MDETYCVRGSGILMEHCPCKTAAAPAPKPYADLDAIWDEILPDKIQYKYAEDDIIADFQKYIDKTYSQHYKTEDQQIECFDAWLALGDATPTFRNTAIKYLWRLGKKKDSKEDLFKALHYVLMCLYNDYYKHPK
jgi:hypothetical protein